MATPQNQTDNQAFKHARATTGAGIKTSGSSVEDPDQKFDTDEVEQLADQDSDADLDSKSAGTKEGQQVRGRELKEKMVQSQADGEKFRSQNQGADERLSPTGKPNAHAQSRSNK